MTGILITLAVFIGACWVFWKLLIHFTADGQRVGRALNSWGSPTVLSQMDLPTQPVHLNYFDVELESENNDCHRCGMPLYNPSRVICRQCAFQDANDGRLVELETDEYEVRNDRND